MAGEDREAEGTGSIDYGTETVFLQVLTALDKEERRLFHDRLRYLDKRITPGVTKLAWTSPKATLDFFYKEACT